MQEAKLIIKYSKILKQQGFMPGCSGNISIRKGDRIFITPSSKLKDELKPEEISCINLSGKVLNSIQPSSEYRMHIQIYKERDDVSAIIHAHPTFVLIYTECGLNINYYTVEFKKLIKKPEYVKYEEPASVELARSVAKAVKKSDLVILKGHGVVAVGKDLSSARAIVEDCENLFKINYFLNLYQKMIKSH